MTTRLIPYLRADTRGGIAQRQDGDVLGSVQPVHCNLGAGGPLHHGYVIVPENTEKHETGKMARY